MATGVQISEEKINEYLGITGSEDREAAKNMLEAFDGNLEAAVNIFLEGGGEMGGAQSSSMQSSSSSLSVPPVIDVDDHVRAPIPQQMACLVEDDMFSVPTSFHRSQARSVRNQNVFDRFRDFKSETEEEEERLRGLAAGRGEGSSRSKKLQDLFKPPTDIMYPGTFQSAKVMATDKRKWLLVNIQNAIEFACQVINRDVWANQTVREILRENFVLWQVYYDSDEGSHYSTFYPATSYPHVAVIDPRTGERVVVWDELGRNPTPEHFCELSTNFLAQHIDSSLIDDGSSFPSKSSFSSSRSNTTSRPEDSVINLTEEEQIEAAMAASLRQHEQETSSAATANTTTLTPSTSDSENEGWASADEGDNVHKPESNGTSSKQSNKKSTTNAPSSSLSSASESSRHSQQISNETITKKPKKTESGPSVSSKDPPKVSTRPAGEIVCIMFRLPDGSRKQVELSDQNTLKDMAQEVQSLGYSSTEHELVKSFPRQNLSELDQSITLQQAGLHKQDTIFVQEI